MSAKTCQICGKRPATATITLAGRPCAVCAPCRKNDWHRETRPGLIPAGKRTR